MNGILFFCSTVNFQQFTRRATIEAIGENYDNSLVICLHSFWKRQKIVKSKVIKTDSFYYFFPLSFIKKFHLINYVNFYINALFFQRSILKYSKICFTFPDQSNLLNFFKGKNIIFILSDPYHLMNQKKEEEEKCLKAANYVFATAKGLRDDYIKKYFGEIKAKRIYWPNCVDVKIWNAKLFKNNKFHDPKDDLESPITIGFAGNFMRDVTDVELLECVIAAFNSYKFILAGKITYEPGSAEFKKMMNIIELDNVEYKGLIPFNQLPAEVATWDVCLMLDSVTEVSKYHHHNKFYQYLALGKPVVYQNNHFDYENIMDVTLGASSVADFIANLSVTLQRVEQGYFFKEKAIDFAMENTNRRRAQQFIAELTSES